jgi:iron(III) transport system permease protein
MARWRFSLGIVLIFIVAFPALMPLVELLQHPVAWRAWEEAPRLGRLAGNTLLLIAGTWMVAMPAGIWLAALLYRTDLPGRRLLRRLMVLALFIPLPLVASGWQAALGSSGWMSLAVWNASFPRPLLVTDPDNPWQPWGQGFAAIWIHALAGLPWVVLLCGQAFRWVERELEEDALLVAPGWRVFLHVTLVRSRATIILAALWLVAQVATEITVTNMMQVRTYAEEVYVQMVKPELRTGLGPDDLVARAMAVSIPAVLLSIAVIFVAAYRWERSLPPLAAVSPSPRAFHLGRWRWPAFLVTLVAVGLVLGIPLGSLVWRAGVVGQPRRWSGSTAWYYVREALRIDGHNVSFSILQGVLAGLALAGLALLAGWLSRKAWRFRWLVLALLAVSWALPGPVVGLGLKKAIALVLDVTHDPPFLLTALHHGPSPVPVMWVQVVRFFPCALALLWPVVRYIPDELHDAAALDGASVAQQLRYVVGPLSLPACLRTIVAILILSLGELSASKLVEPAGSSTFADILFGKMHYGLNNDLAAYCLVLLGVVVAGAGVMMGIETVFERGGGQRSEVRGQQSDVDG